MGLKNYWENFWEFISRLGILHKKRKIKNKKMKEKTYVFIENCASIYRMTFYFLKIQKIFIVKFQQKNQDITLTYMAKVYIIIS